MNEKHLTGEIVSDSGTASESASPVLDWQQFEWLPCKLSLDLPVGQFTVRTLLRLKAGAVVATRWSCGAEVPVRVDGQLIGWAELEPAGNRIGARITELV